ncbi:MAG TPA: discoidin domain-containing protein [Anaeromyxobacteraceae bacterium]|nr:discoidin domain-containing protein [Anaeromyxobacteraceae bacterium]
MQLTLVSSRALLAVSAVALAASAVAQAPRSIPAVSASKAADAALLEIGKGRIRGAVVATARAELSGGAVALLVASVPRANGPAAFALLVFGDVDGAGAGLLGSDELEGVGSLSAPTVVLAADAPRVATGSLTATVGGKAADGSTEERTFIYRFGAGRLTRLLAAPEARSFPPMSGRPSVRQAIEVLPTSAGGFNDLRVRTTTVDCAPDGACAEAVEVTSYRFDGVRHSLRPYPIPFLEKITASSELPSRGGLVDYSAGAAVDGRLDTAWCEGQPGAGWFQKLELTFSPAQRVRAVSIVPGLGTGDAYREVTRPKRVRVLLPEAGKVEADLADEPRAQRIAIPAGERVFGMTLVIVDVYKGKLEDACISELDVEVEP